MSQNTELDQQEAAMDQDKSHKELVNQQVEERCTLQSFQALVGAQQGIFYCTDKAAVYLSLNQRDADADELTLHGGALRAARLGNSTATLLQLERGPRRFAKSVISFLLRESKPEWTGEQ